MSCCIATPLGLANAASDLKLPAQLKLKGLVLSPDALLAYEEGEAVIAQLKEGAKANAAAQKTARLDRARAKLKALKLAAIFSVRMKNPKAALKVAEEAKKVARDIKDLLRNAPADLLTGAEKLEAGQTANLPQKTPPSGDKGEIDQTVQNLIQQARKIIAIAKKATKPGSKEEQEISRLQAATGAPDMQTDVVSENDLKLDLTA